MNIYRVIVSSEKSSDCDSWTIEAGSPGVAISRVIPRTQHKSAKNISASCELVQRNMTYEQYKEMQRG